MGQIFVFEVDGNQLLKRWIGVQLLKVGGDELLKNDSDSARKFRFTF